MVIKQLNVKNRKSYLCSDLINITEFDPSLLRLDKKRICRCSYLSNKLY